MLLRAFARGQSWPLLVGGALMYSEGLLNHMQESLNKHTDPAPMVPGVCPEETVPDKFARNYGVRRFITALPVTTKLWKGFI